MKRSRWSFLPLLALLVLTVAPRELSSAPAAAKRVKAKAERVKRGLPAWIHAGNSPRPVVTLMRRVKGFIDQGNLKEAEARIDQALRILKGEESPDSVRPEPGRPSGGLSYEKLVIQGDSPRNGIYDPSVEYDADGSVGWLAYTGVEKDRELLDIRVAKSLDNGRTWRYVQKVNRARYDDFLLPTGKKLPGSWIYEVSTLLHDPADKGREWKLYAHKYFHRIEGKKISRVPQSFSIVYQYAKDPAGRWSDEITLFGARKFPLPPHLRPRYNLNKLHPDLKHMQAYSEPGSLVFGDTLYLNLIALAKRGKERRLILLASQDHGRTFSYAGTLADNDDARALGCEALGGASIFTQNGKAYLLAVIVRSEQKPDVKFDGAYLFEFTDIARAKLKRDKRGKLLALKRIHSQEHLNSLTHGAGQSTYHEHNRHGGILFPQTSFDDNPEFAQVFKTGIHPLD